MNGRTWTYNLKTHLRETGGKKWRVGIESSLKAEPRVKSNHDLSTYFPTLTHKAGRYSCHGLTQSPHASLLPGPILMTPCTVVHCGLLPPWILQQYLSRRWAFPFSMGDLPARINCLPAFQADTLALSHQGSPHFYCISIHLKPILNTSHR